MKKLVTGALLLLLAAGCGGQDNSTEAANAASNGVDYRQRIADMPEGQRNALFLRAIAGSGLPCQTIEGATAGTDSTGAPAWNVDCADGHRRTIIIAGDGSARILDMDPPPAAAGTAGNSH